MEDLFGLIFAVFFMVVPLVFFWAIGHFVESAHYKSIKEREIAKIKQPVFNIKRLPEGGAVHHSELVCGSVVVSIDYFKRFLAMLRTIVGGRVESYESLLDRGRREAILRMKDKCPQADYVLNVRFESAAIGKSADQKKQIGSVEVLAYGTAVYLQK
jgi:uncharacterized protein YbjQ (UPF0145 family)